MFDFSSCDWQGTWCYSFCCAALTSKINVKIRASLSQPQERAISMLLLLNEGRPYVTGVFIQLLFCDNVSIIKDSKEVEIFYHL